MCNFYCFGFSKILTENTPECSFIFTQISYLRVEKAKLYIFEKQISGGI